MTPGIKPLIAGNWKMNGLRASLGELEAMASGCDPALGERIDMLVCVPATLVLAASRLDTGGRLLIGGQDCHANASGAHTGDVSAEMLADAGASHVIVGHSERRTDHGEGNEAVKAKAEAAHRAGLVAIVCIGETREEREAGQTLEVLGAQLDGSMPDAATASNTVVAYEPVWAIGTGLIPSLDDVAEAHAFMRERLSGRFGGQGEAMRLLYGGSMKPDNAGDLLAIANVDGGLIGGASLKADDFLQICRVCPEA